MACDLTAGFQLGCRDNTGGIRNMFVLSGSIASITLDGSTDEITAVNGAGGWFQLELYRQTANMEETITSSPENGTVFYEQNLTTVFHKLQASLRNQVKLLARNPNIRVIVETNNGADDGVGKYWLLGEQNGMSLLNGSAATGTAFGDLNGYTLTFNGQEPVPAREINLGASADLDTLLQGGGFDAISF
jgi:hypothetical protein